ncbi:Scavenger mRNA decapping enzyme [Klebsormidium nitens]|uniref:m7GpppX diphosphatase n=1 Tax=Klebsormidium nitens TaxID=105231 RepID=A0A1Y1IDP7_KLENI|nr:Scavenger mRNA decapping enzyme [Klebsormidium nitens]|eukprot:GAQ88082.1 Scavenger mRNA decapping enzyme [Klebsormidium nitens]
MAGAGSADGDGVAPAELQTMPLSSFEDFHVDGVLSEGARTKTVTILGRFAGKPGEAIVTLERQHFDAEALPRWLSRNTLLTNTLHNDIYCKYLGVSSQADLSAINVNVIYPATEKHILKYSTQKSVLVKETAAAYAAVTRPYIESQGAERLQWVYNILEKKAEAERLIYEDPDPQLGFTLHPDLKWDQKQVDSLHCVAIVHRRDLHSLRDLTPAHLPLLKNLQAKATQAITSKYGASANELRCYVHYQPSYYHFHLHITHLQLDEGHGMAAGKAHLLEDIIDNLEVFGEHEYYQKRTLYYSIGTNDPLFKRFQEHRDSQVGSKRLKLNL